MQKCKFYWFNLFLFLFIVGIGAKASSIDPTARTKAKKSILPGAYQTQDYLSYLKGKNIALVVNQTSLIERTHLVDSLMSSGVLIYRIFVPEHGFRGTADAGEIINNSEDSKTCIPLISVYGKNKKPSAADLKGIDVVVFDIQDVGVRFYTYVSTLHYVMEACAENNVELMVLDRPNPNGFYIDGPVLKKEHTSFVGLDPVPIVYGMTLGEYAGMLNGEFWLKDSIQCKLKVITVKNYTHKSLYNLPVKPSPNLPNMQSIYLYPSLCLFEGTVISMARGTDFPFQAIGHPLINGPFKFTPRSIPGMSKNPPYEGIDCWGLDLRKYDIRLLTKAKQLNLQWLNSFYIGYPKKEEFFINFFEKLAGDSSLREQIISGINETDIRKSWQPELDNFKKIRKKYLLYKD